MLPSMLRPLLLFLSYYGFALSVFVREPAFRALAFAALFALLFGTVFYRIIEGWSWVDSLYFCTITLASVGYGDFAPTTEASRLFTVVYVILGLGIVAGFLNVLIRAPLIVRGVRSPRDLLPPEERRPPPDSAGRPAN
jgi:voltage-gated potassium channel Kch